MSNHPKIIFAASMPRSGSTWLFNVARILLESQPENKDKITTGFIGDFPSLQLKPLMLIKIHDFIPGLIEHVAKVFYSYRDLRDVLASRSRMFNVEPSMQQADNFIKQHEIWMKHSNFTMKYEDMKANKELIVSGLAKSLGIENFSAPKIIEGVDKLKYESGKTFDDKNHYHPGHITDGRHGSWENIVSESLEKELLDKYHDWFKSHGYID